MCDDKYVFTLDISDKVYVAEHLNETDESRDASLEAVKRWLVEEKPHLNARLEDRYILPFLRGCKFDLDRTKTKLANYYTMKRDRVEWFRDRNPALPEIQELVQLGVFVPLKVAFEKKMVVIIRAAAHDPKKHKLEDVCKAGKMILDVAALENERVQIYGITAVFDLDGVGFSHVWQVTHATIKNLVHAWQNDHCKLKQLEFINAPFHVTVVINILKSFMTEKLRGRVRVHYKGLDDQVDRSILPPEYGGSGESMDDLIDHWNSKLMGCQGWFAEDEAYKAD